MSSANVPGSALRVLAALLLCTSLGCGRVGVRLLSRDGSLGGRADAGLDGGRSTDASQDAALSGDANVGDADVRDATVGTDGGPQCSGCTCVEATYVADRSCGVGYCRTTNTPSRCVAGVESRCVPGTRKSEDDSSCDGVDDDCDGAVDENYASASCGEGHCRDTSVASACVNGAEQVCEPGAPRAAADTTADGADDDCDGQVDEDACVPRSDVYPRGAFMFSPPAHCTTMTVELWGGGGAAGDAQAGYWKDVSGGQGGAGGYSRSVMSVSPSSVVRLYVGGGGRSCGLPGIGALAAHGGGAGGTGTAASGANGQDGSLIGGAGGNSSNGGDGGRGSLGGGGGGAGDAPGFAPHGSAGGGGAASVLMLDAMTVIAGGGGGGGGAGSDIATAGFSGGRGGTGCGEAGQLASTQGGGGGGGGVCRGQSSQRGIGRTPHDPGAALPSGTAQGGDPAQDCAPGGDGYAIISYSE